MKARRPDIVMIHGAFCGPWAFDSLRQPFESAGWRVHTPVLRHHDHGVRPPRALGTTSLSDYAHDLAAFIASLDVPPILIGHSMGGLLAQILAAKGLVRALILLAPCPPWGVLPSTLFEVASASAMLMTGQFWNQVLKPDYGIAAAHSLDRLAPAQRHQIFSHFVPESGLATFEILHWALDIGRAALVHASDVTCPILCLAGEHDRINPPVTVKRVAERYCGRAVYEELEDHSHWLVSEPGWEKIAARMLAWIGDIVGVASTTAKAKS